jgi:hypothetical protein
MEDFDFVKAWNDALIKKATDETPLDSIATRLPPEGQAWLNGLNRFCRFAVIGASNAVAMSKETERFRNRIGTSL